VRSQLRSCPRIVGHHGPLSIYPSDCSILSSEGTPLTHCCQSAQLVLTRRRIKRDRSPYIALSNPLRVNRSYSRIQRPRNNWIIRQKTRSRLAESARGEACWPRGDVRCNCRVRNRPGRRCATAGRRARRGILHGCVDYLSRATLDACEKRRDQAERRKFKFFHKSFRPLNITKVSSLQALNETLSKLLRHWTAYLLAKNRCRICTLDVRRKKPACELQSAI